VGITQKLFNLSGDKVHNWLEGKVSGKKYVVVERNFLYQEILNKINNFSLYF